MKKTLMLVLSLFVVFMLVGCVSDPVEETVYYDVTFDSKGGSAVVAQEVASGGLVVEPLDPTKEGYDFLYWYKDSEETEYVFSTPVTSDITLSALWEEKTVIVDKTPEELIQEDINAIQESLIVSRYFINTPSRGPINKSTIAWSTTSKYISRNGIVLPLLPGEEETEGTIRGRFSLKGTIINHTFTIPLSLPDPVQIAEERTVPFTNMTTEYDVADQDVTLYYEEDGSVPYIKISDFFNLLTGFIDPKYTLDYEIDDTTITVSYDYLDEEENQAYLEGLSDFDGWYHLSMTIDTVENTIVTPDPGFYWGYVYSTATNYGRHIEYDRDNENAYFTEGDDLVYDLDDYNMDAIMYDNDVVIPYYVANQLFAGSSYYNVYYNYDGLFGIYALPSEDSDEYKAMRESSVNKKDIPADLLAHTFNFLGFAFNEFYGTQEVMGVENYYDLLFSRKDEILNDSPQYFDDVLFNIINKDFDEPHTSYGYPGYYNDSEYYGPSLSLSSLGTRVLSFYEDGLYAVDDAITAKWNLTPSNWAASDPNRPKYWFLNVAKTAVVLSLDDFNTSDIEESAVYEQTLLNNILDVEQAIVPEVTGGNKYFFYNNSTQEVKLAEVLIKGLTVDKIALYDQLLTSNGFVHNEADDVYQKTVADIKYNVKIDFDSTFNLFYLGVLALEQTQTYEDFKDQFTETILDLVIADSAVYMEVHLEKISAEAKDLKTVLLDLTFNTGGNVGALYRVLGFVTDQPFKVSSIDADTNSYSISYVYIDGVPNYGHLNWGILQSPATFSAANQMSTIFKENELGVIIGTKSGGGASSITPILLPNGSAFTMSSNSINAYTTETGNPESPYEFHSNEFGIEPDDAVAIPMIYDNATLLGILDLYFE